MPSTEHRRQYPRSWKNLTPEDADRMLRNLDLHFNQPERALICIRCEYALKLSGETVSKHLREEHQTPSEARHRLSAYVKTLRMTDPNDVVI
jgi:hypothetical protein